MCAQMVNEENDDLTILTINQSDSPTTNARIQKHGSNVETNQAKTIGRFLKNNKNEYMIVKNTKSVSSGIWSKFGLPAKRNEKCPDQFDIIQNYSSCFRCYRTYRFTDSSTSSMNDHKCPQELSKGQQQLNNSSNSSSSARSSLTTKILTQKKQNLKQLFVRWVVTGMRPFHIISDSGLENIIQECLDIGRELHLQKIQARDIICTGRTIRNELTKLAELERKELRQLLSDCIESGCLSVSPDIWTDNFRKIAYLGATAHMVDKDFNYHSFDLFCTEFKEKKKTAENIVKLIQQQLSIYDLDSSIDLVTFVTDRGSNFVKGLRDYHSMFCVAHRLHGILKKTFFQNVVKQKKPPLPAQPPFPVEITPTKTTTITRQLSPEIAFNIEPADEEEQAAIEEWENEEEDDDEEDTVDYSMLTLGNIPWIAQEVLNTIHHCKVLVQYVKKTSLNRQIQLMDEENDNDINDDNIERKQQRSPLTTIHQCSKVRWLSMCNLFESIRRSYEPLKQLLAESKQSHRIEKINLSIIEQLVDFLQPWQYILKELQKGNTPSIHVVLPCISYLQDDLRQRERNEKNGMKFFAKRALSLLNSMFIMEDEYILASFLHPKFKRLLPATPAQKAECYRACRAWLPRNINTTTASVTSINNENEPPRKKQKNFLEQLMDDRVAHVRSPRTAKDEVDTYIELQVDKDKNYPNPLLFWKEHQQLFPNLSKLACRIFAIPCSSAAVERTFSAAGQVVTQRRSNLDPSSVNDILFLRSIENNKKKTDS